MGISPVAINTMKTNASAAFGTNPQKNIKEIMMLGDVKITKIKDANGQVRRIETRNADGSLFVAIRDAVGEPLKTIFYPSKSKESQKMINKLDKMV